MEQKTPEQKAEERYRMPSEQNSGFDWYDDECDRAERRRQGYVACYREEVEPRDRIIQELEQARKQDKERIRELENERRWIPVSEREPELEDAVMWCRYPVVEPYQVHSMLDEDFPSGYFTHWQPLPSPPTKP